MRRAGAPRCAARVHRAHQVGFTTSSTAPSSTMRALVQHDHARADLAHEIEVVLDQQEAQPVIARRDRPGSADQRALLLGETRGRLVEQQHARLERQHHGQLERLLHAVREVAASRAELPVEPGRREHVRAPACGSASVPARCHSDGGASRDARDAQRLGDGQRFEHVGGLELAADAERDAVVRRRACAMSWPFTHDRARRSVPRRRQCSASACVLPAPFGPTRLSSSPRCASKLMPSSTLRLPKCLRTPRSRAPVAASARAVRRRAAAHAASARRRARPRLRRGRCRARLRRGDQRHRALAASPRSRRRRRRRPAASRHTAGCR